MKHVRTTQKTIAVKLGISQRAVSKALKGESDISENTKNLVLKTAKELGYTPNHLARSLIDGKSRIIGVIMPRSQGLYFFKLWEAIEDAITTAGYTPLMLRSGGDDKKVEDSVFQLLIQYQAEGLIVMPHYDDWRKEFFEKYLHDNGKVVFIGKSNVADSCCVYNDDYRGARAGVEYLRDLGHQHIGFVGLAKQGIWSTEQRYAGYCDELANQREATRDDCYIPVDKISLNANVLRDALDAFPETTALFCQTDKLALEVFHICKKIGRSVPDDLSILGCNNNFHYPDDLCMPLTTVAHQPELLGKTAVSRIIAMIKGDEVPLESPIGHKLIIRKSTLRNAHADNRWERSATCVRDFAKSVAIL